MTVEIDKALTEVAGRGPVTFSMKLTDHALKRGGKRSQTDTHIGGEQDTENFLEQLERSGGYQRGFVNALGGVLETVAPQRVVMRPQYGEAIVVGTPRSSTPFNGRYFSSVRLATPGGR